MNFFKKIFILFFIVVDIQMFAQDPKNTNLQAIDAGIYHVEKNGYAKSFYKNGKVMSEGFFFKKFEWKHMRKVFSEEQEGLWKFYNEEGKLIREEEYKKGKLLNTKDY